MHRFKLSFRAQSSSAWLSSAPGPDRGALVPSEPRHHTPVTPAEPGAADEYDDVEDGDESMEDLVLRLPRIAVEPEHLARAEGQPGYWLEMLMAAGVLCRGSRTPTPFGSVPLVQGHAYINHLITNIFLAQQKRVVPRGRWCMRRPGSGAVPGPAPHWPLPLPRMALQAGLFA